MKADTIVFSICAAIFCWLIGYEAGHASRPKVCAEVTGAVPISSTADTCTYVMGVMGRAHWEILANKERAK